MSSDRVPFLSLLIPAYNASATIMQALESVAAQNFNDMEVIVVDDGSTDDTSDKAAAFAQRLHLLVDRMPRNSGSSAAFNRAVDLARGRYCMRLDADDTLVAGAIGKAVAEIGDDDILWGAFIRNSEGRQTIVRPPHSTALNDLPICVDSFSLWGKLWKSKLLADPDNRAYNGLDCWDDLSVVCRILARQPKISVTDTPLYLYNVAPRGASLSTSKRAKVLGDHIAIARRLTEWFEANGLSGQYCEFLNHVKFSAKIKYLRGRGRNVAAWKRCFAEVNGRIMELRHVGLSYRLLFKGVAMMPTRLSQTFFNIMDHGAPKIQEF